MCGLVGSYRPGGPAVCDQAVVATMRDAMVHRGPDGAGLWRAEDGTCALGHRRLAIIEPTPEAAQPFLSDDGKVVVAFNGEIYNHAELRRRLQAEGCGHWRTDHSDTEVLLRAYLQWGIACIDRFVGMFAFAIWDGRTRDEPVLHLVRDRLGVKPLYVTRTPAGEWLFGSEIKALLRHPSVSPALDLTAFWHYLTFIVAPAPLTMFRGIFKIPAGWRVTIDHRGQAAARQWWVCRPSAADTWSEAELSEGEAADQLLDHLRRSVERRMVSDVPFGALLSGGVDSSLNVALMAERMDRPVTTFSVGYRQYEAFNELDHARRIAKRFGTDHHEVLIDSATAQEAIPTIVAQMDEPVADNVCIPLYFLSELVRRQGTTVVQVGEGADENFLGYWWCRHWRDLSLTVEHAVREGGMAGALAQAKAWLAGRRNPQDDRAWAASRARRGEQLFWGGALCWRDPLRRQLTPDSDLFRQTVDCPIEGLLPDAYRERDSHRVVAHLLDGLDGTVANPAILQKITSLELSLRLPEHLLMRVDKMTMAHGIEARVPFLDHELVQFAMRLPPSYKLKGDEGKALLKTVAARFLDPDVVYRKKQGFGAPMDHWLGEPAFAARCRAALDSSPLVAQGLIDGGFIGDLLQRQGRGGGWGFHLWTVLNAVIWHAHFIEGRKQCF
jgi:asparagine synthase (glutamine-hydrolysing)